MVRDNNDFVKNLKGAGCKNTHCFFKFVLKAFAHSSWEGFANYNIWVCASHEAGEFLSQNTVLLFQVHILFLLLMLAGL